MIKVKLESILIEQKRSVKTADGNGLDLIGVSNEIGLHISRAKRIDDLKRYKFIEHGWFAYNPMRVNVGSIGYAYKEDQVGIVSPDYVVFSCSDKILPEYLLYILKSDEGIEAINKNASGAVRKRLYFSDLARIEIVLPSIESQRNRLVVFNKIKEFRKQISVYNTKDSLLSKLKQSILEEAIQGKLTEEWRKQNPNVKPASELLKIIQADKSQLIKEKKITKEKVPVAIEENEVPFELPSGWTWCKFKDLVYYRKGKKPSSLSPIKKEDYIIPYIDIAAFERGIISNYTNDDKAVFCNENNILLVWDGSRMGLIGRGVKGALGSTLVKIDIIKCHYEFVFNLLSTKFNFFNSNPKQAGLPHMNGQLLDELIVGLPPIEEQKAIVEKTKQLLERCKDLQNEIATMQQQSELLLRALFNEAFEVSEVIKDINTLFDDVNYNLYVAMIHKQIENRLRINYGEVVTQKTVFNINAFTDQRIPYNFINSNHGTFSPQLKDDLGKNIYLIKDKKGNGEVFMVNPSKEKEVLDALSNPKNKQFIRAVNEVLDIYELPFINKETDKIELLNTVAKLIIDTKSKDLEIIYTAMQKWEIKQNGFKTKAEKFSKPDTKKMIGLIEDLGLASKLLQ